MTKTMEGAVAQAEECVRRNMIPGEAMDVHDLCLWAVGAAFRYMRGQSEPTGTKQEILAPGNIHERGPTALGGPKEVMRKQSQASGFTGDACNDCGNFTLARNGTCTICRTCGATSGCS